MKTTAQTEARRVGRPTKRTPEVERIIFDSLRLGLSYDSAAQLAAVTPETLRQWRRADDGFSADCEKAKGEGKRFIVGKLVENARGGNVAAQIYWLKTRCPEFREPKGDAPMVDETESESPRQRTITFRRMTQEADGPSR